MKRILPLLAKLKVLTTPVFWRKAATVIIHFPPRAYKTTAHFASFFLLLFAFLTQKIFHLFAIVPFIGKFFVAIDNFWKKSPGRIVYTFLEKFEHSEKSTVRRSYLIDLGYKNLLVKKTRTFITILGMSVGVGVIVLLLSLGYGIERLIISQVASLDELKMIDVTIGGNTALRLNESILKKIQKLPKVSDVMPVVSFVGRVTYNNAKSDILVYSASNKFMQSSNLKLSKGKLFDNNAAYIMKEKDVAGASDTVKLGKLGSAVDSNSRTSIVAILPDRPAYVWQFCSTSSKVIGVSPRIEGEIEAKAVWGDNYDHYFEYSPQVYDKENQIFLAEWYKGVFPIYYEASEGQYQPLLDEHGRPVWSEGCVEAKDIQEIEKRSFGQVLGDATASAEFADALGTTTASDSAEEDSLFSLGNVSTDSAGLEVVSLSTGSASLSNDSRISLSSGNSRQAVVSKALLALFNIPINSAIGKDFQVSFILTKSLLPRVNGKAITNDLPYKIIGVIDDDTTPYFYVPLSDIASMKVDNFSQLKIVMGDQVGLGNVRKVVETLGFRTTSTADTISEIESLFNNIRLILGLLGLVALAVASLGMFNTLTVSLLERTREIGGLKTMGMISQEVQDLFLAEAMIMGLAGGFGGLALGFIIGQLLSFLISIIAFSNGQGYLNLTYIPPFLSFFIIISSFIVGLITGLYPSRRARKISALNALRYE
jgi:ABC-type antimicrobial peptide transport system permease subunit